MCTGRKKRVPKGAKLLDTLKCCFSCSNFSPLGKGEAPALVYLSRAFLEILKVETFLEVILMVAGRSHGRILFFFYVLIFWTIKISSWCVTSSLGAYLHLHGLLALGFFCLRMALLSFSGLCHLES